MHKNRKFGDFWDFCKIVFVLSHGQSTIEHGFNVNKDLLVENLGQQPLIGQHMVYDCFTSVDTNIYEYVIPNNLVKSCKLVYWKYKIALEQKEKRKSKWDWQKIKIENGRNHKSLKTERFYCIVHRDLW